MAETKADRARCSVREIARRRRVQPRQTAAEAEFTFEDEK